MSQRGGRPAQGRTQNGRQQIPQQQAPAQYDEQQDQGQEEKQQDQEQYDAEDPSQYDEGQPQEEGEENQGPYGAQEDEEQPNVDEPTQSIRNGPNGVTRAQQKQGQKGHQATKGKPTTMAMGQQKAMLNGNSKQGGPKAITAAKPATIASQASKGYHPSHQNALHFMAKTASNGFTPEHIQSLLHLGTYALGALANTHGLAPPAPVEE